MSEGSLGPGGCARLLWASREGCHAARRRKEPTIALKTDDAEVSPALVSRLLTTRSISLVT